MNQHSLGIRRWKIRSWPRGPRNPIGSQPGHLVIRFPAEEPERIAKGEKMSSGSRRPGSVGEDSFPVMAVR